MVVRRFRSRENGESVIANGQSRASATHWRAGVARLAYGVAQLRDRERSQRFAYGVAQLQGAKRWLVQGSRNILWLTMAEYYGLPRPSYLCRSRRSVDVNQEH